MGKWTARLIEKAAALPAEATDETDERGVPSVSAVLLGPVQRDAPPAAEPVDTSAVAWTDANMAAFVRRRAELRRWGWPVIDAELTAERLVIRDREQDERVSCTECAHFKPYRCGNYRAADLMSPDLGRDLASRLQRCPGFRSRGLVEARPIDDGAPT